MKSVLRSVLILMAIVMIGSTIPVWADEHEKGSKGEQAQSGEDWQSLKQESRRMRIDEMADGALEALFKQSIQAQDLFERSYGWAAFDNWKFAFMVSGGGGHGVAINKETDERIYMKMGTGGIGLGIGGQKSQVVFLFATEGTFLNFIENGWQADAGARAAAGTSGVNATTAFVNGIAVFQMTQSGLMANADIAGTKYWKNKNLNQPQ
jgi:lipid-binding SYLF domain-containing protein